MLDARELVEGEGLVPASHSEEVEGLVVPGAAGIVSKRGKDEGALRRNYSPPAETPHRGFPSDADFLIAVPIPDGDLPGEHTEGEELPVVAPRR